MALRILLVDNNARFVVSHRIAVALAAQEAGYEFHVATPDGPYVRQLVEAGIVWHPIRLSRASRNPVRELRTVRDLVSLYRRVNPSIVHHVTPKPVLYGTIAARWASIRGVVNAISGVGHVFAHDDVSMRALRAIVRVGYRVALRHPHMRVIFQNVEQRQEFVARRWVREDDAVLIPGSGVDMDQFTPRVAQRQGPPIVVLASRMLWTKGVGEFVEAAARLRREGIAARFVLVGDPDPGNPASISENMLRAWAARGDVEYWGRRDDMPEVLAQSAIACLPTYSEGLPKSLVEAAACGLPVVATDIPGCRAVVSDGENGFLVPPRDARSLAAALRRLLVDPALRERAGAAGRLRAVKEFSLARVIDAHLKLYAELASVPGSVLGRPA
jgi:glycosyltransferase involved in cell wall biosynthesis